MGNGRDLSFDSFERTASGHGRVVDAVKNSNDSGLRECLMHGSNADSFIQEPFHQYALPVSKHILNFHIQWILIVAW